MDTTLSLDTTKFILWSDLPNFTELKLLTPMHYNDHSIKIFKRAITANLEGRKNDTNYYFEPKCYLDHESASSYYNNTAQTHEMNFTITFWDDHLQSLVLQHLRRFCDHNIRSHQISVFPYDKVTLKSLRDNFNGFQLPICWKHYPFGCHKVLEFKLICDSASKAKELANEMRRQPYSFSDFYLLFGYVQSNADKRGSLGGTVRKDIIIRSSIVFKEENRRFH